jgi:hypothetical protein
MFQILKIFIVYKKLILLPSNFGRETYCTFADRRFGVRTTPSNVFRRKNTEGVAPSNGVYTSSPKGEATYFA